MNVLARKKGADEFAARMQPLIEGLRNEGYTSWETIARQLNERQVPTRSGGGTRWYASTVRNVLVRLNGLPTEQIDGE